MAKSKQKNDVSTINREVVLAEAFQKRVACYTINNVNPEDFQYLSISDMIFTKANLTGCNFSFCKLENVIFQQCNLGRAVFNFAELVNVRFIECELNNLYCNYTVFLDAKFTDCELDCSAFDFSRGKISFENCQMERNIFVMTRLDIIFKNCNCERLELSDCPSLKLNAENTCFASAAMNGNQNMSGVIKNSNGSYIELKNSDCTKLRFVNSSFPDIDATKTVGYRNSKSDIEEDVEKIINSI